MKREDLSFKTKDENGEEVINDILSVIPNSKNSDEPYVVYTDYDLDDNDEFIKHYAKLVKTNDQFSLLTNLTEEEIKYINNSLEDEIVKYVNDTIGDNINE